MTERKVQVGYVIGCVPAGGVSTGAVELLRQFENNDRYQIHVIVLRDLQPGYGITPGPAVIVLNLPENAAGTCAGFHRWLEQNPMDILVMNDVKYLEPYWPFVPECTATIVFIHDEAHRYSRAAIENHRHLDAIATVARFMERQITRQLPGFRGILKTVYNGQSLAPGERTDSDSERIRLLHVTGTDFHAKGTHDLPDICRHLHMAESFFCLWVFGNVPPAIQAACEKSSPHGLFAWPGRVPHSECVKRAARSDVFLALSRSEAFGMAMLEAMSQGAIPVIYDIESGPSEIVEHGINGFKVRLEDAAGIAAVIARIQREPEMRRRLSAAAIRRACADFNGESMGRNVRQLFTEVLDRRISCRPERRPFAGSIQVVKMPDFRSWIPRGAKTAAKRVLYSVPGLGYRLRRFR